MKYTIGCDFVQAYIPDNEEGVKALHGIYLAWEQRLLFKVGTSLTNGMVRARMFVLIRNVFTPSIYGTFSSRNLFTSLLVLKGKCLARKKIYTG